MQILSELEVETEAQTGRKLLQIIVRLRAGLGPAPRAPSPQSRAPATASWKEGVSFLPPPPISLLHNAPQRPMIIVSFTPQELRRKEPVKGIYIFTPSPTLNY